jgi:hypothetical protein
MDWDALNSAVASCTRCTLCDSRRNAVIGRGARRPVGSPSAPRHRARTKRMHKPSRARPANCCTTC